MKTETKFDIRDMALCALFAALIAAGAFVKIPLGAVPVTLQLLFTNLAGLLLGKRRGAASVLLYIFIGLAGLPVFTAGGGLSYVLQPSFGYLIGMVPGAYAAGWVAEKGSGGAVRYLMAGCVNILFVYLAGVPYFYAVSRFYLGSIPTLQTLLVSCCLVFIPGDAAGAILGALLAKRLRPLVYR